jgi:glycosyltransferase involved in cell wall biosynthesis
MTRKIKILFVGELHSSHAQSWIDLIFPWCDEFEIRGLHISWAPPPAVGFPIDDASTEKVTSLRDRLFFGVKRSFPDDYIHGRGLIGGSHYANLEKALQEFKPDIVHTLGIFPASVYYLRGMGLLLGGTHRPVWIAQARGGPDLALNRKSDQFLPDLRSVFERCDCFLADNAQNYSIAMELGLAPEKVSPTGSVPGSGGIDPGMFSGAPLPSIKERLILWPKAYNCIQSDGLVVVEALRRALPRIGEFQLLATAAMPDVEYWFREFLGSYGDRVRIVERMPREELLKVFGTARVMLAPSLSEGIPNSMFEAMASNTVPILSPLDTLTPLFKDNINTIYAHNLDPDSIADALVKAMTDDELADRIAVTNSALLPSLAGRDQVRERVSSLYRQVVRH